MSSRAGFPAGTPSDGESPMVLRSFLAAILFWTLTTPGEAQPSRLPFPDSRGGSTRDNLEPAEWAQLRLEAGSATEEQLLKEYLAAVEDHVVCVIEEVRVRGGKVVP